MLHRILQLLVGAPNSHAAKIVLAWVVQQRNGDAHKSAVAIASIRDDAFKTPEQPLYSLDLGPSDFYLLSREECGLKQNVVVRIEKKTVLQWFDYLEGTNEIKLTKKIYRANSSDRRVGKNLLRKSDVDQTGGVLKNG
ncbi:hypothetical protein EVAR_67480_1 [Eumeta japonica]|uniref:Uncharacterized protein n=1 Tax=Eumeta variegata TaxID=151549 RepID=A0A4C1ZBH2_EUMVA|nr:hypothetical protein EVAR_67480_1 [Eumeta japonica]